MRRERSWALVGRCSERATSSPTLQGFAGAGPGGRAQPGDGQGLGAGTPGCTRTAPFSSPAPICPRRPHRPAHRAEHNQFVCGCPTHPAPPGTPPMHSGIGGGLGVTEDIAAESGTQRGRPMRERSAMPRQGFQSMLGRPCRLATATRGNDKQNRQSGVWHGGGQAPAREHRTHEIASPSAHQRPNPPRYLTPQTGVNERAVAACRRRTRGGRPSSSHSDRASGCPNSGASRSGGGCASCAPSRRGNKELAMRQAGDETNDEAHRKKRRAAARGLSSRSVR